MASARERLLAANNQNKTSRGDTSTVNTNVGDFVNRNNDQTEKKSESVQPIKKIKDDNQPKKEIKKKEPDKIITYPLLLTDDNDEYFIIKANMIGSSFKDYFKTIMIKSFDSEEPDFKDPLVKSYQKRGNGNNRRTVEIPEELRERIKKAACKFGMKQQGYINYIIAKERLKDKKFN